jgi:hypothetical protein
MRPARPVRDGLVTQPLGEVAAAGTLDAHLLARWTQSCWHAGRYQRAGVSPDSGARPTTGPTPTHGAGA